MRCSKRYLKAIYFVVSNSASCAEG